MTADKSSSPIAEQVAAGYRFEGPASSSQALSICISAAMPVSEPITAVPGAGTVPSGVSVWVRPRQVLAALGSIWVNAKPGW